MGFRIEKENSWKKQNGNNTFNGLRIHKYDQELVEKIARKFLEEKNYSYLFKPELFDYIGEGTVLLFSNNDSQNKFKTKYLGIINKLKKQEFEIDLVCCFKDYYNPEASKIDYTLNKNIKLIIDSNISPIHLRENNSKNHKIHSFHLGVLRDDLLSKCLNCKEEYFISLI